MSRKLSLELKKHNPSPFLAPHVSLRNSTKPAILRSSSDCLLVNHVLSIITMYRIFRNACQLSRHKVLNHRAVKTTSLYSKRRGSRHIKFSSSCMSSQRRRIRDSCSQVFADERHALKRLRSGSNYYYSVIYYMRWQRYRTDNCRQSATTSMTVEGSVDFGVSPVESFDT